MSTLPPDVISNLLSPLPVKSLLRFRCTSKQLCSVVDDPDFAKLHLTRSAQAHSHQSLILAMTTPLLSIDLRSPERTVEIEPPLKTLLREPELVGCCNGLLCLFYSYTDIVLWNMSTRKHHRLPYTAIIRPNKSASSDMISHFAYGFGYDSVHDDYKLVRIILFGGDTQESEVMVYGLKSNSWKRVFGRSNEFLYEGTAGMFADGAVHWLVDSPEGGDWLIVAFDFATEEFREVPRPAEAADRVPFVQLGVWGSCLCLIRNRVGERTDMWVRKHCELEDSWTKLLSTSKPQVTSSSCCIMPMACSSNGNELLLLKDYKKFLKYDLKRNIVKNARIHGLPDSFDALLYVESLVKPFPTVQGVDETVGMRKSGRGKKNATKRDDFLSAGFKLAL